MQVKWGGKIFKTEDTEAQLKKALKNIQNYEKFCDDDIYTLVYHSALYCAFPGFESEYDFGEREFVDFKDFWRDFWNHYNSLNINDADATARISIILGYLGPSGQLEKYDPFNINCV